jgi:hypothetical protein
VFRDKILAALWVASYALVIRVFATVQILEAKGDGTRQKPL